MRTPLDCNLAVLPTPASGVFGPDFPFVAQLRGTIPLPGAVVLTGNHPELSSLSILTRNEDRVPRHTLISYDTPFETSVWTLLPQHVEADLVPALGTGMHNILVRHFVPVLMSTLVQLVDSNAPKTLHLDAKYDAVFEGLTGQIVRLDGLVPARSFLATFQSAMAARLSSENVNRDSKGVLTDLHRRLWNVMGPMLSHFALEIVRANGFLLHFDAFKQDHIHTMERSIPTLADLIAMNSMQQLAERLASYKKSELVVVHSSMYHGSEKQRRLIMQLLYAGVAKLIRTVAAGFDDRNSRYEALLYSVASLIRRTLNDDGEGTKTRYYNVLAPYAAPPLTKLVGLIKKYKAQEGYAEKAPFTRLSVGLTLRFRCEKPEEYEAFIKALKDAVAVKTKRKGKNTDAGAPKITSIASDCKYMPILLSQELGSDSATTVFTNLRNIVESAKNQANENNTFTVHAESWSSDIVPTEPFKEFVAKTTSASWFGAFPDTFILPILCTDSYFCDVESTDTKKIKPLADELLEFSDAKSILEKRHMYNPPIELTTIVNSIDFERWLDTTPFLKSHSVSEWRDVLRVAYHESSLQDTSVHEYIKIGMNWGPTEPPVCFERRAELPSFRYTAVSESRRLIRNGLTPEQLDTKWVDELIASAHFKWHRRVDVTLNSLLALELYGLAQGPIVLANPSGAMSQTELAVNTINDFVERRVHIHSLVGNAETTVKKIAKDLADHPEKATWAPLTTFFIDNILSAMNDAATTVRALSDEASPNKLVRWRTSSEPRPLTYADLRQVASDIDIAPKFTQAELDKLAEQLDVPMSEVGTLYNAALVIAAFLDGASNNRIMLTKINAVSFKAFYTEAFEGMFGHRLNQVGAIYPLDPLMVAMAAGPATGTPAPLENTLHPMLRQAAKGTTQALSMSAAVRKQYKVWTPRFAQTAVELLVPVQLINTYNMLGINSIAVNKHSARIMVDVNVPVDAEPDANALYSDKMFIAEHSAQMIRMLEIEQQLADVDNILDEAAIIAHLSMYIPLISPGYELTGFEYKNEAIQESVSEHVRSTLRSLRAQLAFTHANEIARLCALPELVRLRSSIKQSIIDQFSIAGLQNIAIEHMVRWSDVQNVCNMNLATLGAMSLRLPGVDAYIDNLIAATRNPLVIQQLYGKWSGTSV